MQRQRGSLSQEARDKARLADKERLQRARDSLSQEARDKANLADKERMQRARDSLSPDERNKVRAAHRERKQQERDEKNRQREEAVRDETGRINIEWFAREDGDLPAEARALLDESAGTGEWWPISGRVVEVAAASGPPAPPTPPPPPHPIPHTPPHFPLPTPAAVIATAQATPDPDGYLREVVEVLESTATGRSLIHQTVTDLTPEPHDGQRRPLQPREGVSTGKRPAQGRLTNTDRAVLKEREERNLWKFHRELGSLGSSIATCRCCGVRRPGMDPTTGCTKCGNGKGDYTAGNRLSLRPTNNAASEQEEAERAELLELMAPGQLTQLELALIKPAVSIVGIRRLRSGQFGFSGHTITLSQDVDAIARDLPRTVADAGIIAVSDLEDKNTARENVNVKRAFRVRRDVVARALELLIKYHVYMRDMYSGVGVSQANLDALPEDGVPRDLEILHNERFRPPVGPGELAITPNLVFKWLEAGEEDVVAYPIGSAAYAAWAPLFNFEISSEQNALIGQIQATPAGRPLSEMVKIQDLMSYISETSS